MASILRNRQEEALRKGSEDLRVGFAGAIGSDDGRKVRITKEQDMVASVGFEVCD